MSLAFLPAQSLSEETNLLSPNNLESILAKIDSVRAPKSEGLVFVRIWVDQQQTYERMEVLASTNTELAIWVKHYIPQITWNANHTSQKWYDLRLSFEPIVETPMPMVNELQSLEFENWNPPIPEIKAPNIAHKPYKLPYISIDDSELRILGLKIDAPALSQDCPHFVDLSMLPVPERSFPYIPLETEALQALKTTPTEENIFIQSLKSPAPILLVVEPLQFEYVPLDCEGLSMIKKAFSSEPSDKLRLDFPEIPIFETPNYTFPYIPLETDDLQALMSRPSEEEDLFITQINSPRAKLLAVEALQFEYIPLDFEGLSPIKNELSFEPSEKLVLDFPKIPILESPIYALPYISLETAEIRPLEKRNGDKLFNQSNRLVLPTAILVESQGFILPYIGLDCTELRPLQSKRFQVPILTSIIVPTQVESIKLSVPGWKLPYIALDTDDLAFIAVEIREPTYIADLNTHQTPNYRAPAYVPTEIFDPIDTKGIKPLLRTYNRLSTPQMHAPVFKVERPEFQFHTYLDTEDLQSLGIEISTNKSISPALEQRFYWRPEIPVSQYDIFDLEREVSIPWMPEIAIFPQNMQEILDRIPYPESARKLELEGEVRFKIWLDEEGRYLKHEVMESLPYLTRLCEYLLPDVEYLPVLLHGNPVPFQTEITFYFDMNRGNPSQCHYQDTRVTDDEFSY